MTSRRLRPKVNDGLIVVTLEGEAVIYDERREELHHLNRTATVVFGLCDGTATIAELAREIAEAFGQPAADIEPQIRSLLRRFKRIGLLEASSVSS